MKKRLQSFALLIVGLTLLVINDVKAENGLVVDVNGKVGIGTTSPGEKLHVHEDENKNAVFKISSNDPTRSSSFRAFNDNNQSVYFTTFGSAASGTFFGLGVAGLPTLYTQNSALAIGTNDSYDLTLGTNNRGRLTISGPGNVGIGTTNQFGSGLGVLSLGNAVQIPSGTPTGAALFYVSGGEMFVKDAGGNVTQISPHPASEIEELADREDPYPHFEKSTNMLIGKEIVIDKGKAFRLLQTLFPKEKFIWYRDVPKAGMTEERREAWKKDWKTKNTREEEIARDRAFTLLNVEVENKTRVIGEKVSYDLEGRDVVEVKSPVYAKKTEQRWELGEGVTFDTETGRFFRQVIPTDAEAETAAQQHYDLELAKWVRDRM